MIRQNSRSVGAHNRAAVISLLVRKKMSRADLAKATGLTRASITVIIDGLMAKGIIKESERIDIPNGRRPTLIEIQPDLTLLIGIDITRSGYVFGACDLMGNVLEETVIGKDAYMSADDAVEGFAESIKSIYGKYSGRILLGIGITSPGPVNALEGKFCCPLGLEFWNDFPICKELRARTRCKNIWLENNAVSRALSENYYGLGSRFSSFLELTVFQGIGCGIITNHQVFLPENGISIGIGHTTIDVHGHQCRCGNIGCLELYATPQNLLKTIDGIDNWGVLVQKAEAGDRNCKQLIKDEAGYLVSGLIPMINVFSPQAVILTGELSGQPDLLIGEMDKQFRERLMMSAIVPCICASRVTSHEQLRAACALVMERYYWGKP